MILVLFSMSRWKRFDLCVYVYVLNWELGSISASVGNETRGVTMWKRNERNRTKQKTGRGREKKEENERGKKKLKKQKWKLPSLFSPLLPTASSPGRKAYFRAFPPRSRKKKERKRKKKNVSTKRSGNCFYLAKWIISFEKLNWIRYYLKPMLIHNVT